MADTRVATGLTVEQWDDQFFTEYVTDNRFSGEFGTSENSLVQVKENLTKAKGDRINFALVNRLSNEAVTGRSVMEGNEEDLASRSFALTVNRRRNAVAVDNLDEQFSAISLRRAARAQLMTWAQQDTEDLIIRALPSINGVRYSSATEAQKDAWLVDNADRVLFGAARSNNSTNDHSASLANCDTTNDKLTAAAVSKMKAIAETVASPMIRPVRSVGSKGRRYYVMYAHPYLFNDLKADSTITEAQRDVQLQMENERLFEGGDILWDGVIVKQIERASAEWNFGAVGASSATVCGAFLCGAQALGVAYAKRWVSTEKDFDYAEKKGVQVSAIYGVEKLKFGSGTGDTDDLKDHGVVTGYFATLGLV